MRIGIIAPPWIPIPPPAYGGIESFIDTLACALQDAGHDVVLAASADSTSPVPRLEGFEPSARGMRAALPYLDLFAPAHSLESLAALEPYLARI